MRVIIPYATQEPKTRLADTLSADERKEVAEAMLADVITAVQATDNNPEILATTPIEAEVPVIVDNRPLTDAVNGVLAESEGPVAVVMADLALVTHSALKRLFEREGEVVIAPGRGGGTNALVIRHPPFRVDYHGVSYLDHKAAMQEVPAEISVVDSYWLATDVDERTDLAEVLIHNEGETHDRLQEMGFSLSVDGGRANVVRK